MRRGLVTLISCLLLSAGCAESPGPGAQGGDASTPATPAADAGSMPTAACVSGPAKAEGQVLAIDGTGMPGVKVSIGGCSATTDEGGYYTLTSIAVAERQHINFSHLAYFTLSHSMRIKAESPNYVEITIPPSDYRGAYDNAALISNAYVALPGGQYVDQAGNRYSEAVIVDTKYLEASTAMARRFFPAITSGIDSQGATVQFVSHGVISVGVRSDDSSQVLAIDGSVELIFPAEPAATEQSIALWHYDYQKGLWTEQGEALRQADGSYRGHVSRLGTWNLGDAIYAAPGIYRGRIIFENQEPAQEVRVFAVGSNWIASDLSTDADGQFELEVVPDRDFVLEAYNYKDKYGAAYAEKVPGVASGEIVEERL